MDVMDCLWNQIYLRMVEKRSPSFSHYIMKLICEVWHQKFDGSCLEPISHLTEHHIKKLLIKDHGIPTPAAAAYTVAPATATSTPTSGSTGPSAPEIDGFPFHMGLGAPNSMYDPMLEPSWYKKLKIKVNKTFCLQLDIQDLGTRSSR
jgi:hypothetical protein